MRIHEHTEQRPARGELNGQRGCPKVISSAPSCFVVQSAGTTESKRGAEVSQSLHLFLVPYSISRLSLVYCHLIQHYLFSLLLRHQVFLSASGQKEWNSFPYHMEDYKNW